MAVAAISAPDLTYIQGHTRGTVKAQKPRLKVVKENHKNGLPVCTVAPAVTGTATVGQTLTCNTGTWLNSPAYAYQWKRRAFGSSVAIAGATAATHILAAPSSGYQVECEVIATNGGGSVTTRSNIVTVP